MYILLPGISKREPSTEPAGFLKALPNNKHHHCLSVTAHGTSARQGSTSAVPYSVFKVKAVGSPAVPDRHTSWGTKGLLSYKCSVKLK